MHGEVFPQRRNVSNPVRPGPRAAMKQDELRALTFDAAGKRHLLADDGQVVFPLANLSRSSGDVERSVGAGAHAVKRPSLPLRIE